MSEFQLIEKLKNKIGTKPLRVLEGIGDDCAVVIPPAHSLLATVDALVEGVHFDFKYFFPSEVGHKALAVNLSDIAAMGGVPLYALVSLGVGRSFTEEVVLEIYDGILSLAQRHGVALVGGNISKTEGKSFISITLLGEPFQNPILRTGAQKGDVLLVTGSLGRAKAGYEILKAKGRKEAERFGASIKAQLTPEPRVAFGIALGKLQFCTSLIDISDGLSSDLEHLVKQNRVGFELKGENLPISKETKDIAALLNANINNWALSGGEDYELLFTVHKESLPHIHKIAAECGVEVSEIGKVVEQCGITIEWVGKKEGLKPSGWNHL